MEYKRLFFIFKSIKEDPMTQTKYITDALHHSKEVLTTFLSNQHNIETIKEATDAMVKTFKQEGRIYSCGNGGSMCDAMHFAEELTGRFRKDRVALGATAISEPGHITCVANDFGFEYIFSKYIEGHGRKGDFLLAISTSGNSQNVIKAAQMAKSKGMKILGLLGKDGGALKDMVDFPLIVNCKITDRVQEVHIKCIHILIEGIERQLFPEHYV